MTLKQSYAEYKRSCGIQYKLQNIILKIVKSNIYYVKVTVPYIEFLGFYLAKFKLH